ncbi:MAG: S1C family serine protease, partial [Butyricicoccus sp.]|nr:S1C family serine protease [Butyricicoccus sp.]
GGGALGGWFVSRNVGDAGAAANDTVLNMAVPAATPAVSKNLVASGDVLEPSQIYDAACEQVVGVTTEIVRQTFFGTSSGAVTGSGFIISADGYILTNHHVIEDAVSGGYDVKVYTHDGTEYIASIVGYEADNDVAVLKIDADGLPAATIGDSDAIQVGQSVYAVGNPLGELQYSMSTGTVSALDREISFTDSDTGVTNTINMFQIDAAVNSGNSGGPVYNDRGEVIGIVTAKYGANTTGVEGLGFAIPVNDAVSIANDIITMGYVRGKALLGIMGQSVTAMAVQYYNMVPGAYVTQVNDGSCAEKAGVKAGDIIVALGDEEISSWSDLASAKKEYRAGETATLKVYRGGEYLELSVTFDEDIPESTASVPETQAAPETDEHTVDGWPFSGMGRP